MIKEYKYWQYIQNRSVSFAVLILPFAGTHHCELSNLQYLIGIKTNQKQCTRTENMHTIKKILDVDMILWQKASLFKAAFPYYTLLFLSVILWFN